MFYDFSVEEAKKKIYACSTTTYHGFQVEVSEEVSEQFKSMVIVPLTIDYGYLLLMCISSRFHEQVYLVWYLYCRIPISIL